MFKKPKDLLILGAGLCYSCFSSTNIVMFFVVEKETNDIWNITISSPKNIHIIEIIRLN